VVVLTGYDQYFLNLKGRKMSHIQEEAPVEKTIPEKVKFLEVPEVINFGEDDIVLNYDDIIKATTDAKQKVAREKKAVKVNVEIILSNEEILMVDKWVKDLEKYIAKFAAEGSDKFSYDCAKVQTHLFYETAKRFKTRNPKFYVETHGGTQMIVVTWHGKNEV
jgi:hypothetical protein